MKLGEVDFVGIVKPAICYLHRRSTVRLPTHLPVLGKPCESARAVVAGGRIEINTTSGFFRRRTIVTMHSTPTWVTLSSRTGLTIFISECTRTHGTVAIKPQSSTHFKKMCSDNFTPNASLKFFVFVFLTLQD